MGKRLSALKIGTPISLRVSAQKKSRRFDAVLKKRIDENTIQITLLFDTKKKLIFDNVKTDLEYYPNGNVPTVWSDVKVTPVQSEAFSSDYSVQVVTDGKRHNRRDTYRVGISAPVQVTSDIPNCPEQVILRDISLTGFSVTDEKKNLPFKQGDVITVLWTNLDHELTLTGQLIRVEEQESFIIYGFEICNVCKDLASYINVKQIQRRK